MTENYIASFQNKLSNIFCEPKKNSFLETQCFFGNQFQIFDEYKSWVRGKLMSDNYIGWVKKKHLTKHFHTNQILLNPINIIYSQPNIKSKPIDYLFLGSQVFLKKFSNEWSIVHFKNKIGYIHKTSFTKTSNSYVSIAENFINTQYLWGGKSINGIDCSGLIQISLFKYYPLVPRNSSDQEKFFSNKLCDSSIFKRGDLIFWPGHVGIMSSPTKILHASGHDMKVINENLDKTAHRLLNDNLKISSVIRLIN